MPYNNFLIFTDTEVSEPDLCGEVSKRGIYSPQLYKSATLQNPLLCTILDILQGIFEDLKKEDIKPFTKYGIVVSKCSLLRKHGIVLMRLCGRVDLKYKLHRQRQIENLWL